MHDPAHAARLARLEQCSGARGAHDLAAAPGKPCRDMRADQPGCAYHENPTRQAFPQRRFAFVSAAGGMAT